MSSQEVAYRYSGLTTGGLGIVQKSCIFVPSRAVIQGIVSLWSEKPNRTWANPAYKTILDLLLSGV